MKIEHELDGRLNKESLSIIIDQINEIQSKVNKLVLPLAYANELYALREHVEYVKSRCSEK